MTGYAVTLVEAVVALSDAQYATQGSQEIADGAGSAPAAAADKLRLAPRQARTI